MKPAETAGSFGRVAGACLRGTFQSPLWRNGIEKINKEIGFDQGKTPEPPALAAKPKQSGVKLDAAIDRHLADTEQLKGYKTWLAYRLSLTEFFKAVGNLPVDEITTDTLKNFSMAMKREGLGDRTIHNRLVNIVTFLRTLGIKGMAIRFKYTEKAVSAYTQQELAALFAACTPARRAAAVPVLPVQWAPGAGSDALLLD